MTFVFMKETQGKEEDRGTWFIMGKDTDTQEEVRFRIRAVPDVVLRQIHRRHFGSKRQYEQHKMVQVSSIDIDKASASGLDKAVYALTETENLAVEIAPENAEAYTRLLGRPVKGGEVVVFDEHLTREVKELLLGQFDEVVMAINEKSDEMKKVLREDEDRSKS
jgi:hypothetical protein